MIFFHDRQKADIGLQFVLDRLSPRTPFGNRLVRELRFFSPDEAGALSAELDNVGSVKSYCEKSSLVPILDILSAFKDISRSIEKCGSEDYVFDEVELFEIKNFLISLDELIIGLDILQQHLGLTSISLDGMDGVLALLDPDGKKQRSFYVYEAYSEKLSTLRIEKRRLEDKIRAEGDPEVKARLRQQRLNTVCAEDAEEQIIRAVLTEKLKPYAARFNANFVSIGYLDFLLQKGLLAAESGATRAIILEGAVAFKNVRNPYFEDILYKQGKSFMPVSIECGLGTTVLTGANMGGKSVALKTITLNLALFHAGFFVFAEEARLSLFESINLVSEDLQSVDRGLSTFAAEVVRLQQICYQMQRGQAFVALDELGRGTNPSEGAAIARAVAEYMNTRNVVALITTHYDGVTAPEFARYQVVGLKNADMDELKRKLLLKSAKPFELIAEYMDYSLIKAPPGTEPPRDARNICRLLNLNEELLGLIDSYL